MTPIDIGAGLSWEPNGNTERDIGVVRRVGGDVWCVVYSYGGHIGTCSHMMDIEDWTADHHEKIAALLRKLEAEHGK